ncbi:hypothetical protein B0J17DRAFT_656738 [Rhizoctonia solani]|nr:hypothetical protein B0J17DRAFT_656738 [Rhizoctonia solani]
MVGLSVFTFSSGQHVVISVLIAVFTGVVSFKLVAFGLWITLERLTYSWTGGGHWFLQVHSHVALEIPNYMINKVKRLAQPQATTPEQSNSEPSSAIERGISHKLPLDSTLTSKPPGGILSPARRKALKEFTLRKKLDAFKDQYPPPDPNWRRGAIHITHADKQAYINNFELLDVVWQHKGLIKHLAFNPNDQSLLATCGWDGTAVISYIDQKSGKSTIASKFILSYDKNTQNLSPIQPQGDQQLLISPQLSNKEISVREEIRVKEEACVREVTWSLDGKKLATRTRKTVRIWDSENGNLLETIRASANEPCTIEGIAWTTQGTGSTNEQNNGENSRRKTKHDGGKEHHGGDNGGDDSASIEKNGNRLRDESKNKDKKDKTEPLLLILEHICKVDQKEVGSTAICRYRQDPTGSNGPWVSISRKIIENAKIISIGVVNDSLLVAVGIDTGGDPKNEAEKFMFLYNFVQGEVMRITPLTGAVRNISVTTSAKNTAAILVTYKHQGAYPQLWRIKLTNPYSRDHSTLSKSYCDFTYVQSYFSKETSDFSGRGGFGGLDNGYVCCSSQGGEIFVWDRITGLLVGTINPANDEHIKFFACNKQACPDFKCASGAVDGILSLCQSWT